MSELNECSVCGQPCGWGERHRKCGEAIMAAENKQVTPEGYALVPIDGIRYAIGILESNFGPMIRQATADGLKKLLPKMIEIAKEVQ